ncbi:DUF551 domain-containing protein [Acinetobacter baumannii]|uniref:DUF551 domain-containing protein n=1 Tax=Acinetobacter baumannii TaxID=470 RepID=UPI003AF5BC6B
MEWISVDEQMPEVGKEVLVFRPKAHLLPAADPNFKVCTYAGQGEFIGSYFEHAITHWAELKAPNSVGERS